MGELSSVWYCVWVLNSFFFFYRAERKRISALQLEESFCMYAPPSSLTYLPTNRIFGELRQQVFNVETEISSELKPVEAEVHLAGGRCGQDGPGGVVLVSNKLFPCSLLCQSPGCFPSRMLCPELRGQSQDFHSCGI